MLFCKNQPVNQASMLAFLMILPVLFGCKERDNLEELIASDL
jgi:hypothetical protein